MSDEQIKKQMERQARAAFAALAQDPNIQAMADLMTEVFMEGGGTTMTPDEFLRRVGERASQSTDPRVRKMDEMYRRGHIYPSSDA